MANASDKTEVARARKKDKERRLQERMDLKFVLATPAGRRVFWRLIHEFRPNTNIFEFGVDETILPYRAGFHDAGILLMNEIAQADESALVRMAQEDAEARRREVPPKKPPEAPADKDEGESADSSF